MSDAGHSEGSQHAWRYYLDGIPAPLTNLQKLVQELSAAEGRK